MPMFMGNSFSVCQFKNTQSYIFPKAEEIYFISF